MRVHERQNKHSGSSTSGIITQQSRCAGEAQAGAAESVLACTPKPLLGNSVKAVRWLKYPTMRGQLDWWVLSI